MLAPLTWHPQSHFKASLSSRLFSDVLRILVEGAFVLCVEVALFDLPSQGCRQVCVGLFVLMFPTPGMPCFCPVSFLHSG